MPKELRELALRRVQSGELPTRQQPEQTLGGPSDGAVCALCGHHIPHGAPEIELAWNSEKSVLHPACHGIWLSAQS
jgi:hypothetical protein